MKVRGIRGATTARRNEAAEILDASRELLQRIVEENRLVPEEIAAVHFSVTPDLDQAFPARAAREMGWTRVPLFCHVEIAVPDALPRCIRILVLVNTELGQEQIRHVYLREARKLREDLL